MKKKLIITIGIIALCTAFFLTYNIIQKYNENKLAALQKQRLPNFKLYDQEGESFSSRNLKDNAAVCVFYYNAECEHCQYEAEQISKNINSFKDTQVLMVSTNTPAEAAVFAKTYKLDQAGFIWLYDKDYSFYKWFGKSSTPSVYIYNAEHHLVKEYRGEVKIEAVLKYLDNGKEG